MTHFCLGESRICSQWASKWSQSLGMLQALTWVLGASEQGAAPCLQGCVLGWGRRRLDMGGNQTKRKFSTG